MLSSPRFFSILGARVYLFILLMLTSRLYMAFTLLICMVRADGFLRAQDIHFSQVFNAPLLLNPSHTGYYSDEDFRAGMMYRLQQTPAGAAYNTLMAWSDVVIQPRAFRKGWMGLGIYGARDNTTGNVLTTYKGSLSTAYHHIFSNNIVLSVGIAATYVDRGLDRSKLIFGDQFNGIDFDINIPTADVFFIPKSRYFSLQPSVMFSYIFNEHNRMSVGVSMENVNVPRTTFIDGADPNHLRPSAADGKYALPFRYNMQIEYSRRLSDAMTWHSYAYVAYQSRARQTLLGTYLNYDITRGRAYFTLSGGVSYRINRSAIFYAGLGTKKLKLGLSYDLSIIKSTFFLNTYPAFEVSLIYKSIFPKASRVSSHLRSRVKCTALQ